MPSRPLSALLPVEDLQHMTEEIQGAITYASRLCFNQEDDKDAPISRSDVQVLYAKMESISSNWHQLIRTSEAFRKLPLSDSIDENNDYEPDSKADSKSSQKLHRITVMAMKPGRPATRDQDRLNLESRGALPSSESYGPESTEGISLGTVLLPQYKTANIINKLVNSVIEFLGTNSIEKASPKRANSNEFDNQSMSDFSVGSKGTLGKAMSIDGAGASMRSLASSPSARHRNNKSPSGRRYGKKPQQRDVASPLNEKVLFARKTRNALSLADDGDDEHVMTIYSATGVDKGTNTDSDPAMLQLKDIEQANSMSRDDLSAAEHSIISQISFPESVPPKSKYVLDPLYAHFPELGVPSSPYAVKRSSVPDPRIVKELKLSPNPLATLYNEYWQFIPSVFRSRLLSTAAIRNEYVSSRDSLTLLFDAVLKEVEKLELSLNVCSKGLDHSTKLTQSLIAAGEKKKLSPPYREALSQLLVNVAEIEVSAVWSDIQLMEYRDMFHKFHHMGIPNMKQMIKSCTAYRMSQQKFVACENIARGVLDRVMYIKSQWASTLRVAPEALFVSEADIQMRLNEYIETINTLRLENRALEARHRQTSEQLQSAAQEILVERINQDRTPSALLFYVTLLDPSVLPSLHTIIDEMKQFKKFVAGEIHFEYTSVRRGLEVCTTVLPYIERFLSRFNDLKKKWVKDRIGKFTVMGLAGGDADATSVCPLCNSDTRLFDRK